MKSQLREVTDTLFVRQTRLLPTKRVPSAVFPNPDLIDFIKDFTVDGDVALSSTLAPTLSTSLTELRAGSSAKRIAS